MKSCYVGKWEVGRGDTATCRPDWGGQSTLQGLPLSRSTTPIFLLLRLHAATVGVTEGWPQALGLLSRARGERDAVQGRGTLCKAEVRSCSKGQKEHMVERGLCREELGVGESRRGHTKGKKLENKQGIILTPKPPASHNLLQ